jgi:uncharacterized protein YgiB involved in biofilm formation
MQKRGKLNNLSRFRKTFSIKPLSLAVSAALLTACGSDKTDVMVVQSPEDCVNKTSMTIDQCEVAYKEALAEAERTGPRYRSLDDCIADFGPRACYQPNSSGGFFMPFMAGWMISSAIDGMTNRRYYNPVFQTRYERQGNYVTAGGGYVNYSGLGRYKAPYKDVTTKAPAVTKTVSRGGFGSTASAKSSWGGGGKASSWGG